ncbi:hypothetical protein CHU98_g8924 [Xylaria longipes]|nr:hypothetical protein CHU98_g8924 [Xylaria longipes]
MGVDFEGGLGLGRVGDWEQGRERGKGRRKPTQATVLLQYRDSAAVATVYRLQPGVPRWTRCALCIQGDQRRTRPDAGVVVAFRDGLDVNGLNEVGRQLPE